MAKIVFQDEEGQNLNRYKLTPVDGQPNVVDLERMAIITKQGTPYSKEILDHLTQDEDIKDLSSAVQLAKIGNTPVAKVGNELQFPAPTSWIATTVTMADSNHGFQLSIPNFSYVDNCQATFTVPSAFVLDLYSWVSVNGGNAFAMRTLSREALDNDAFAANTSVTVSLSSQIVDLGGGSGRAGTAFFKGGAGGGGKYNVFLQPNEPTTKQGIWLKGNADKINKVVFDTNTWAAQAWKVPGNVADIPEERAEACCALVGNEIFIFGGYGSSHPASAIAYNPATNSYRNLANMPEDRSEACCALVGSEVFIFGNGTGYPASAIAYNPATNSYRNLANMPEERANACCALVGNEIFIFGGYISGSKYLSSSAIAYNPSTNSYRSFATMPDISGNACCALVGNEIFIFGGYNRSSVIAYNPATNSYRNLANMPEDRTNACCALVGSEVFIFGGRYHSAVIAYNPATNSYRNLANMPENRSEACCALVGNEIFIFGGMYGGNRCYLVSADCMSLTAKQYPNNGSVIMYYLPNDVTHVASLITSKLCDYLPSYFKDVMWFKDGNLWFPELYVGNGSAWVKLR